jgi:hypothetical protein
MRTHCRCYKWAPKLTRMFPNSSRPNLFLLEILYYYCVALYWQLYRESPVTSLTSSSAKQPFFSHSLPLKKSARLHQVFTNLESATIIFTEQGRQSCIQPPTWRTRSLCLWPPIPHWNEFICSNSFFAYEQSEAPFPRKKTAFTIVVCLVSLFQLQNRWKQCDEILYVTGGLSKSTVIPFSRIGKKSARWQFEKLQLNDASRNPRTILNNYF